MLSPRVKNPGIMQRQKEGKKQRARRSEVSSRNVLFPATAGGGRVKARIHRWPAKIYRSKYRARALDSVEVYKGPCPVTTNFYSHPPLPLLPLLPLSLSLSPPSWERVRKSWGRPGYLRVIVNCTRLLVYPGI